MSQAELIKQTGEMIDFYRRSMIEYRDRADNLYHRAIIAETELEAMRAKLREITDERDRLGRELDFIASRN
jgi:hypothetical protein